MGTFGVGLYQDDEAADLQALFKQLWRQGIALDEARRHFSENFDQNSTVFWLTLADLQWESGLIEPSVVTRALDIISSGADLQRWKESPTDLKARSKVLSRLAQKLESKPKKIPKLPNKFIDVTDWHVGEVLQFPLSTGKNLMLRVAGYYTRFLGKSPVIEVLDWYEKGIPSEETLQSLPLMLPATHGEHGKVRFSMLDLERSKVEDFLIEAKNKSLISEDTTVEDVLAHEEFPYVPLIRVQATDRAYKHIVRLGSIVESKRMYVPYLVDRVSNIYREWKELEGWADEQFALSGKYGMVRRVRSNA